MRLAAVVAVVVLAGGAARAECPVGSGTWTNAAGAPECRPCLSVDVYDETTPLPKDCPALRAGILWTVTADAEVAQDLRQAEEQAAGLGQELWRAREALRDAQSQAAAEARRAEADLEDAATLSEGVIPTCPEPPSPWRDRLGGFGVGAAIVGAVWLGVVLAGG